MNDNAIDWGQAVVCRLPTNSKNPAYIMNKKRLRALINALSVLGIFATALSSAAFPWYGVYCAALSIAFTILFVATVSN